MIDLEQALVELSDRLEIPGGDRVVGDVMQRIAQRSWRPDRRRALRLAGALVVVAAVAVVALPGPRRAVARWLGFDSVRIEPGVTVPTTTTVPDTTSAVPGTTATPAVDLDLGQGVTIDEAVSQTGLADPTPAALGPSQSVHVVRPPDSGQIVLVYAPSDVLPESSITGVGAQIGRAHV